MSTSGGGATQRRTATVAAASIAALFSAPVEVVPAPGAGKAIAVVSAVLEYVAGATGFVGQVIPALYYGAPGVTKGASSNAQMTVLNQVPVSSLAIVEPAQTAFVAPGSALSYVRTLVENVALVVGFASSDLNRAGPIATSTLAAGGAGYVVNDTGTIDVDTYVGGAAYKVLTVGGGGAVLTYQLTAAGDGYSLIDNPLPTTVGGAQPGLGVGLTINAVTLAAPTDALYVTAVYEILTLH